ncbi:MAG: NTP transferase domain-containing protein [Steroidobacteraceae bacterium]
MTAKLLGLVLAGGRSTRMQRDKAALQYRPGQTQLAAAVDMLRPHVAQVFVSVRPDQRDDATRRGYEQIVDQIESAGPIAGILAAQSAHPDAAWWVLACDLPFLDEATLADLAARRDAARDATAYRSSHDSLPEPLCAIFEPRTRAALAAYVGTGRLCPRKFLLQADTLLLDPPNARALDNANTSDDYWQAMAKLNPQQFVDQREICVQYFALLREQAGCREEKLVTSAPTPRVLYEELRKRHPFSLAADTLRIAINGEFADWSRPLQAGDTVVFIPPVAGG